MSTVKANPGNANLPLGYIDYSSRLSSVDGANPGNANLLIGNRDDSSRLLSVDGANPGNANLPIGNIDDSSRLSSVDGANREIGVPRSVPKGWWSRCYLPHFDSGEVMQYVTLHLADSLSKQAIERLEAEIMLLLEEKHGTERRKRMEEWLDAGHGSCVLQVPEIAEMVQDTLFFFDGERYRLLAWVIMPSHVHVLLQPINGWSLAKIMASWKKFTAIKICAYRRLPENANLPIGEDGANRAIGVPRGIRKDTPDPVWHREFYDRFIRDEVHYNKTVGYIHQNPVKAGMVKYATDWQWSSAFPGNANLPIGD